MQAEVPDLEHAAEIDHLLQDIQGVVLARHIQGDSSIAKAGLVMQPNAGHLSVVTHQLDEACGSAGHGFDIASADLNPVGAVERVLLFTQGGVESEGDVARLGRVDKDGQSQATRQVQFLCEDFSVRLKPHTTHEDSTGRAQCEGPFENLGHARLGEQGEERAAALAPQSNADHGFVQVVRADDHCSLVFRDSTGVASEFQHTRLIRAERDFARVRHDLKASRIGSLQVDVADAGGVCSVRAANLQILGGRRTGVDVLVWKLEWAARSDLHLARAQRRAHDLELHDVHARIGAVGQHVHMDEAQLGGRDRVREPARGGWHRVRAHVDQGAPRGAIRRAVDRVLVDSIAIPVGVQLERLDAGHRLQVHSKPLRRRIGSPPVAQRRVPIHGVGREGVGFETRCGHRFSLGQVYGLAMGASREQEERSETGRELSEWRVHSAEDR